MMHLIKIDESLLRRIKAIEIRARKLAEEMFAGEYLSAFKGRGMEFSEVREYEPGDEFRLIDWNVTARRGFPHVKRFVEERELSLIITLDLSGSMLPKLDLAVELCALLAISALKNNDKAGLIAFTDRIELLIPPSKARSTAFLLIRKLLTTRPLGKGTDLSVALDRLMRMRRGIAFLISDFLCEGFERKLRAASKKHDLIALIVREKAEVDLPSHGLVEFEDPETGRRALIDLSEADRLSRKLEEMGHERKEILARCGVDHVEIAVGEPYIGKLIELMRRRAARR
ncbi:DUF58 domain-containing protein [Candidatus Poribacteria bacterium]|nr:MAG: DUF58 domain-containing protein [Candidatus Poribacteria bacterium]